MEPLSKKTTILFPDSLHAFLAEEARRRGTSLGELVRMACEERFGFRGGKERLTAVEEMAHLALPVADVATMKRESTSFDEPPT